jgi:hypothetical protein
MNNKFSASNFSYLSENRVGRRTALVEPIQKGVVVDIDEELRTSRFRTASVGHGKSSWGISDALVILSDFIRDASSTITLVGLAVAALERGACIRSSSSGTMGVRVLGYISFRVITTAACQ